MPGQIRGEAEDLIASALALLPRFASVGVHCVCLPHHSLFGFIPTGGDDAFDFPLPQRHRPGASVCVGDLIVLGVQLPVAQWFPRSEQPGGYSYFGDLPTRGIKTAATVTG